MCASRIPNQFPHKTHTKVKLILSVVFLFCVFLMIFYMMPPEPKIIETKVPPETIAQ
jgi:uncharacterized BrkB/YihY/UPF0761 family membrane protein